VPKFKQQQENESGVVQRLAHAFGNDLQGAKYVNSIGPNSFVVGFSDRSEFTVTVQQTCGDELPTGGRGSSDG
jgi:hypothetical protein